MQVAVLTSAANKYVQSINTKQYKKIYIFLSKTVKYFYSYMY